MAIGAIGGGAAPIINQAAQAVAPAAADAGGGANTTGQAIDQNMLGELGAQGMMQLGQEVQQEAQKVEQKNQQRAKEMLAEAKKDG